MAIYDDKVEYEKRKAGGKDFINLVIIGTFTFSSKQNIYVVRTSALC